MGKFAMFLLRLFGWNIDKHTPEGVDKCVVVMGPHTSNWDFIIGRLAFASYGVNGHYLIKKELFFFPLGWFLKSIGGIPVDRKGKSNMTDLAVRHFKNNEKMFMVFTPEGTRSYNPKWKKGFYYIAQKANVPIYIGYMDYEKKIGGFHSKFTPTGDVEADIQYIKDILKQYKGKYPEKGID
ncbi:MAG: 1-acyl-sn-glycerol-3-phosphate acyltransferase [Crocinitomicaceae bacterium]|nr:1-acyl-sn-glycerol-3-phosphate acyltransferase [Crocinitomicaceae bacterium]